MPFDANLVLRGYYGTTGFIDCEPSDTQATTIARNSKGNAVVDLGDRGTGIQGMDCVVIFGIETCTDYQDTLEITIEDSDHLTDGWHTLLSFPTQYCYMRELIITATVAFIGTDIGLVATASGGGDVGVIREFSRKLLTVGGVGKMWVEMQSDTDTYATSGDTITATSGGGGYGTMVGVGRVPPSWGLTPHSLVRRFSTPKRYLRSLCTVSDGGNFKHVNIYITGSQSHGINNLLMG